MMGRKLVFLLALCLWISQGYSQQKTVLNKKVYLFIKYEGDLTVETASTASEKKDKISHVGDTWFTGFIPYDHRWSMDLNMRDLHAETYKYLYNDVFLANGITRHTPSLEKIISLKGLKKEVNINLDSLSDANKSLVVLDDISGVAKIWVLDGEWEQTVLDQKPDYLQGRAPKNLIFSNYNMFVLKRINSLQPLKNVSDRSSIKIVENASLAAKKEK